MGELRKFRRKSDRDIAVSVCMIVRDEESRIKDAVESAWKVADEVIVSDTGSVDRTPEIAEEAGATVFRDEPILFMTKEEDGFDRIDFAANRNRAAKRAKGRWIVILDGDEVLKWPHNKKAFASALDSAGRQGAEGAVCAVTAVGDDKTISGQSISLRVHKNVARIQWERPVHNQLTGIEGSVGHLQSLSIVTSYDSRERAGGKDDRSAPMLEKVFKQTREAWAAHYLSTLYASQGKYPQALKWCQTVLDEHPKEVAYCRSWHAAAHSTLALYGLDAAEKVLYEGLSHHPNYADLHMLRTVYALARLDIVAKSPQAAQQYATVTQVHQSIPLAPVAAALHIQWPYVQALPAPVKQAV